MDMKKLAPWNWFKKEHEDADRDHVTASFKNGILRVNIPRKPLPAPDVRKIEIQSS